MGKLPHDIHMRSLPAPIDPIHASKQIQIRTHDLPITLRFSTQTISTHKAVYRLPSIQYFARGSRRCAVIFIAILESICRFFKLVHVAVDFILSFRAVQRARERYQATLKSDQYPPRAV